MQVYNEAGEPATDKEQAAPDLDRDRRLRARGILRGLDALKIEDSIARAERKEPDSAGRTWRIGAHVGKMCRQLVYWEDKSDDPDYRVHKTGREWFESEAGITRGHLRTATRIAVDEGLLTVEPGYRSDRRQTNYYRLNMWNLFRTVVGSDLQSIERQLEHEGRKYRRDTLNRRRRALETALNDLNLLENGESSNTQSEVHGGQVDHVPWSTSQPTPVNLHPLQENTQEITAIDSPPGGAGAPQQDSKDQKAKDRTAKASKTTPSPDQPNGAATTSAKGWVSKLVSDLEARGEKLDAGEKRNYGKGFKDLIGEGVDAGELEKVQARIVSEWSRIQLSLRMALRDVRGEIDTKTQGSPAVAIEALRNYSNPKTGKTDLREYAGLAQRFDFTDDTAKMDWRMENELSRDKGERQRLLQRIQNVCQRAVEEDKAAAMGKMGPFASPDSPTAPTESPSPALEDAPEGHTTPEPAEDEDDALVGIVDRLQADPDSKPARLARAVIQGRRSSQGPITTKDVAAVVADDLDVEALGYPETMRDMVSRTISMLLVARLQEAA